MESRPKYYYENLKKESDAVFKETSVRRSTFIKSPEVLNFDWWFDAEHKIMHHPIISEIFMGLTNSAETSLFLCLHGFYDSANSELRCALDNFLTKLYYYVLDLESGSPTCYEEPKPTGFGGTTRSMKLSEIYTKKYFKWKNGEGEFPKLWQIYKKVFSFGDIKKYNKKFKLEKEVDEFYFYLSKWTHKRPPRGHSSKNSKSSIFNVRFDAGEFDKWKENFGKVYEYFVILIVLICPRFRNTDQFNLFERHSKESFDKLKLIFGNS